MNPLSPLTYYLRHKRSAILQIALVGLVTTSMFLLVAVLDAIPLRANSSYLGRLSRVSPMGEALDAAVISRIQTHPGVALVIPDNGMRIAAPSLFGNVAQRLLGVSPEEAEYLMQHCDVRLAQGRMFEPRTNELVLSAEVARALDLDLGSEIEREAAPSLYREVSAPLVLVGILEGTSEPNTRLGFVSAEYLASHELYMPRSTSQLVVAWPGSKTEVDGFLETEIEDEYSRVETLDRLVRAADITRSEVFLIFGIVNSVVAVAVAFVVGVINQIAISRRLDEFGVLHALGRPRRGLIRRLTMEAAVVVGTGFLLGLAAALAILSWLKVGPFYDLGVDLSLTNPAPFCFVLPTPLVAVALTFWSVSRLFARLDAVSIVEQGSTSQESRGRESGGRTQPRLSAKALSSVTFCLRHQRRVAMMILGTSLMVLVTAFPVFFLSATLSASQPEADYLLRVSEVYSIDSSGAAAGIYGQIRSHPAVERIVPAFAMGIQMILPPIAGTEAEVYAVSETDLPVLLELYDLRLHEGRMPRPRSNEILISAGVASNRDLCVGDVIGGATDDDSPVRDFLPVEMEIVGILSPDRPWIGFASYEYLQNHELTSSGNPNLLIVPREGQKQELDSWLEEGLDPTQMHVTTYAIKEREYRETMANVMLIFALLEYMIAAVAAVALATLNYIFFAQRKREFGILNALGRSRSWQALRTVRETGGILGVAWVLGAAVCGVGLLAAQTFVYSPRGLTVDLFNPMPWLLTASLPLTVVLISTGTTAWMLSRLDPVAMIERR